MEETLEKVLLLLAYSYWLYKPDFDHDRLRKNEMKIQVVAQPGLPSGGTVADSG